MKLATFEDDGCRKIGIVAGDAIIDSQFTGTMIEVIARWDELRPSFEAGLAAGGGKPLAAVKLCAPVQRPGKIWAIGLNYADHVAESNMTAPERQVWFTKAVTAINGPFDPIEIARGSVAVDYEVELVAVVGRRARHVSAAQAAHYVFGYCVGNDVSERNWQLASPQWSLGKSFDTHAPIGPWLTTADEIRDPHGLGISCAVNGEVRQNSSTRHLVFNLWQQIEHLSAAMTLEPGDLIFTGTPGGVGMAMKPPTYLKPGDVVHCEIDRLGAIEAPLIADA